MIPPNPFLPDGTLKPDSYEIDEDGCHIWLLGTNERRPAVTRYSQRTFIRNWLTGAEPGRKIRATCGKPLCVNPDHLFVLKTTHEETAELLSRLPVSAIRAISAADRELLELRASGLTVKAIGQRFGIDQGTASNRLLTAEFRLHRALAKLEGEASNP